MENKKVGLLLISMSILISVIVFLFNNALTDIVNQSCSLAGHESCTMYETIEQQTYLSLSLVGVIVLIGFLLIFSKPEKEVIVKEVEVKRQPKEIDDSDLREDEKQVLNMIKEDKAIFQANLIERTNFGKAKMSRIIDRLEGKGIVERKRRGMTNIIVLKEN